MSEISARRWESESAGRGGPARRTSTRQIAIHDGLRMSWRERGRGPAVVLAAGLGLSSSFYEDSYEALSSAGVRLLVPDLPGWGETPGPLTGISPCDSAAFLAAFSEALGLEPAVWIGHSLGAQAVVELARHRPELVRGIVLVGPTGRPGRLELARQAAALAVEATRASLHVLRGVVRDYVRTPPQRYIGTWLRHGRHDLAGQLRAVPHPVLILVGDRDPVCTRGFIHQLEACLPAARVEWVRGGTHALPRGCAAEFNARVARFVLQEC
jgi:2-hydroxy-6-oxonona-2,4-dienedioate hydrolase